MLFIFTPTPGEMIQFDHHIFVKGVGEKPPTSSANPTGVRMGLCFRNTWTMKMALGFLAHDASMGLAYLPAFTIFLPLRNNHSCRYIYIRSSHGSVMDIGIGNTFNPRSWMAQTGKKPWWVSKFEISEIPWNHPFCWFSGEQLEMFNFKGVFGNPDASCIEYLPTWKPPRNYPVLYTFASSRGGAVLDPRDLSVHKAPLTSSIFGTLWKI